VIPVGHGVDIVSIARIEALAADIGWLARCFSDAEIAEFPAGLNRAMRIAGRFAAKEAVLKALGTGQGAGIAFADVIIRRADGEPPRVALAGQAAAVADEAMIHTWLLSISHADDYALASALAFRLPG
jgi:holo-[acyl-carrier protein] synthase